MLSNFVANAIRYTERAACSSRCRKRGGDRRIEVWDTGIGIPSEQHERIFEEFYQLNNPSRDRTRGLGLGLATVRRIVAPAGSSLGLRSSQSAGARGSAIEVPVADPARIQDHFRDRRTEGPPI